jgi:hypothetical protein
MSTWPAMLVIAAPLGAAGFVFGLGYFMLIKRSVSSFMLGASWQALALVFVRLVAATCFFAWTTKWGIAGIGAALAGFVVGRFVLVRATRSR